MSLFMYARMIFCLKKCSISRYQDSLDVGWTRCGIVDATIVWKESNLKHNVLFQRDTPTFHACHSSTWARPVETSKPNLAQPLIEKEGLMEQNNIINLRGKRFFRRAILRQV